MFSHLISHFNEDDMYIMDVSEVDSVLDLLGEQDEEEKLGYRFSLIFSEAVFGENLSYCHSQLVCRPP
ncbi:hypothetical protein DPMN_013079 [Dreissena polymorpha]|uniref:Uncharacterized protein n=1 Tax=Dreissena polymorpha TaxID=45954 RepID=A0A9D4S3F9_DREPO|nr:hypothetical protein DPMN_013079 [Dreissena polymorpha]